MVGPPSVLKNTGGFFGFLEVIYYEENTTFYSSDSYHRRGCLYYIRNLPGAFYPGKAYG